MDNLRLTACAALYLLCSALHAQQPLQSPVTVVCDESAGCTHQFIDGQKFKIITTDKLVIMAAVAGNGHYMRADVNIANNSATSIDVLPKEFSLEAIEPKDRILAFVPPEKIVKSAAHRAGWANAINAVGAGMATQQTTTQTSSSGTVSATASDGTYANGTYNGTGTSTTTTPNYTAQAQARENIRRRRAALAAMSDDFMKTSLKSNTLAPGQVITGFVYFESGKKAQRLLLSIPIAGVLYQFPLQHDH